MKWAETFTGWFMYIYIYYWNKVTVHHLKLCYFLMKKDNTMICGVLLNHCLTVNRIISKSVCLDTRLRDTSLKRCGVKSQFTNSVSCVSIIGVDASLTTTTHASSLSILSLWTEWTYEIIMMCRYRIDNERAFRNIIVKYILALYYCSRRTNIPWEIIWLILHKSFKRCLIPSCT